MATTKTLTPTNQTISIPELTDSPDMSVASDAIDKEADAINTINGKVKSIAWNPQEATTLLAYINANIDKNYLPASIIKNGQSVTITDLPTGLTAKEFVANISGNGIRDMVELTTFGGTSDQRVFFRDIYNGNWANDWQELALNSNVASLSEHIEYGETLTTLNNTSLAGGNYFYGANTTGAPTTTAGRLMQIKSANSSWGGQIAVPNSSSFAFYARMLTSSGYGEWQELVSKNDLATSGELSSYTGTTSGTVTLNEAANKYALMSVYIYDSNNQIVGAVTASPLYFRNVTVKVYGESSSQWGSVTLSNDYTQATINRTQSNTSKVRTIGFMKIG